MMMNSKQPSGYIGNRNAVKPAKNKKSAVIYLRVTPGQKARAVKRCHPRKLAATILDFDQVKELLN